MCIENHFFIGPRIIFAVSRIYFLAYNALRALQFKGTKNTHFLQTSSPGGWRFSTSRYIKYGERSVLNETWCSSTEKYFSRRFASVFNLFSHIQLRIIAGLGKPRTPEICKECYFCQITRPKSTRQTTECYM